MNDESATEHDRRHSLVRGYLESVTADTREISESIRHVLEGFLRVAFPEHFPPGTLLGPFKNRCTQRVGGQDEIMSSQLTQNLDDLTEYANLFHHETNPLGWETVVINDGELRGFVERTLIFARR